MEDLDKYITALIAVIGAAIAIVREFLPKNSKALQVLEGSEEVLKRIADPKDKMQAPTPDNPSGE